MNLEIAINNALYARTGQEDKIQEIEDIILLSTLNGDFIEEELETLLKKMPNPKTVTLLYREDEKARNMLKVLTDKFKIPEEKTYANGISLADFGALASK